MTRDLVLAIDQGTTSTRAMLLARDGQPLASAQEGFPQLYPCEGHVEHDPEDIWRTVLSVCRRVVRGHEGRIAAIGIASQRESVLLWDRDTGAPLGNVIVWQDRRTARQTEALGRAGAGEEVRARTGLLLDPYFSASKIAWLLDNIPGARQRAEAGRIRAGTIDSFLVWRLTGGKRHLTDVTNASRTSLLNIHTRRWDDELLRLFNVPASILPEIRDNVDDFGCTDGGDLPGVWNIGGVAGDQQAASIGQACLRPGMAKGTYGTGCFVMVNTGEKPVFSKHGLLATIAFSIGNVCHYALEGSIFSTGATIQWLRDQLGLLADAAASGEMAGSAGSSGVFLVPAFSGLGAPWWDPDARGAILGLTRGTGAAAIVRAALESCALQTHDLAECFRSDGIPLAGMRVDGGMAGNDWLAQNIADITGIPVVRPRNIETTVAGAAFLAGLSCGLHDGLAGIGDIWQEERTFLPAMPAAGRKDIIDGWHGAVRRVLCRPPVDRS